jgi:hypothetical protein
MSRLLTASLSAAVLIALAPAVRAADDDPKAIVLKAIKAHGGEEFMSKNKAAQIKNKGKIDIPGVGEVDFTQEVAYMLPDKLRESFEIKVMGQNLAIQTLVFGDKVSIELNGKEIDGGDKIKEAMKSIGHVMTVGRLVPLVKEKGYELSLIGEDKVEGKKVIGIRVTKKDQKDVSVYFDKETGLLAKLEFRSVAPGSDTEITEERIVKEYEKNKDGIPMPKKVMVKHDGKTFLEAEVLEIKYFEKLDDSEFKK